MTDPARYTFRLDDPPHGSVLPDDWRLPRLKNCDWHVISPGCHVWLGYGDLGDLHLRDIREQLGPHRIFVATWELGWEQRDRYQLPSVGPVEIRDDPLVSLPQGTVAVVTPVPPTLTPFSVEWGRLASTTEIELAIAQAFHMSGAPGGMAPHTEGA